jgi:hypothetical protein
MLFCKVIWSTAYYTTPPPPPPPSIPNCPSQDNGQHFSLHFASLGTSLGEVCFDFHKHKDCTPVINNTMLQHFPTVLHFMATCNFFHRDNYTDLPHWRLFWLRVATPDRNTPMSMLQTCTVMEVHNHWFLECYICWPTNHHGTQLCLTICQCENKKNHLSSIICIPLTSTSKCSGSHIKLGRIIKFFINKLVAPDFKVVCVPKKM